MENTLFSHAIYDIVVREVDAIYPRFLKKVNDIDLDYFENITRDSEVPPKELNFELRDKVIEDLRQYAMQLIEQSNIKERIRALLKNADEANAKQAVKDAREMLHSYSYLSCILNGNSYFTEEELQQLYTAANRRNLWERITQTNKNDVIEFHHALMDKTYEQCKDIFYSCLESFMHDEIN
jgi:hypothetical protein